MKQTNKKLLDLTGSRSILEQASIPWKVCDTVTLTRQESLRLIEMIENPVIRNEKFKKAMTDYSRRLRISRMAPR